MLDKVFENMIELGWKGLNEFNKKELLEIHLEGIIALFESLQGTEHSTDSLGFVCDFLDSLLKEV